MTDSYQKEIEDKKLLEENLLGEVCLKTCYTKTIYLYVNILREK